MRMRVVLPEPLGPKMAVNDPGSMANVASDQTLRPA